MGRSYGEPGSDKSCDVQEVKDPDTLGVLKMTWDKLVFVPNNPHSATKLDVHFKSIKDYKNTKEGSNKPSWLNLSNDQGKPSGDLEIPRLLPWKDPTPFSSMSESVRGKAFRRLGDTPAVALGRSDAVLLYERISTTEMELRIKLLKELSELQILHKQLVIGGILTEAEFWATRKRLLEKNLAKSQSNVWASKVTNKVTFNLTPEIILQIFIEKPAVHATFLTRVPSKMTEKEFWAKYFKAEYIHSTRNAIAAAAEAAEDEDLAIFLKNDDISAKEARLKVL